MKISLCKDLVLSASLFLFSVGLEIHAQRVLSVPNVNASPGSRTKVPVQLDDGSGISAIQFKVRYPTGLSLPSDGAIERGTLLGDHGITSNTIVSGVINITVVSLSLQSLKSGSGSVVIINFDVANNASGELVIQLQEMSASDPNARAVGITSQPGKVIITGVGAQGEKLYFAQFGNGMGTISEVTITNPSSTTLVSGKIEFLDNDGLPLAVGLSISSDKDSIDFSLQPWGTFRISTDGQGRVVSGSARVSSDKSIGGVIRFSIAGVGIAGVGASQLLTGFITPVRRRSGVVNTGIALQNAANAIITVNLSLRDKEGRQVANGTRTVSLPPLGHIAQFMQELFPTALIDDFEGALVAQIIGGKAAATALELGAAPGQFTSLPVTELK